MGRVESPGWRPRPLSLAAPAGSRRRSQWGLSSWTSRSRRCSPARGSTSPCAGTRSGRSQGDVLDRLGSLGLDCLVVQDLALAETVYSDPRFAIAMRWSCCSRPGRSPRPAPSSMPLSARGDGFPRPAVREPATPRRTGCGGGRHADAVPRGADRRQDGPRSGARGRAGSGAREGGGQRGAPDASVGLRRGAPDRGRAGDRLGHRGRGRRRLGSRNPDRRDAGMAGLGSRAPDSARGSGAGGPNIVGEPRPCGRDRARMRPRRRQGRSGVAPRAIRRLARDVQRAPLDGIPIRRSDAQIVPRGSPAVFPLLYVARPCLYAARRSLRSLTRLRRPDAGGGPRVRAVESAAARSGGPSGAAADRASASPRSWE